MAAGDDGGDDDDMPVDETDKIQARALAELKNNAIDLLDDDISAGAVVDRLGPLPPPAAATAAAASTRPPVAVVGAHVPAVVKAEKRVA